MTCHIYGPKNLQLLMNTWHNGNRNQFVFVHWKVHLPSLTLFCSNSYFSAESNPSLHSNFVVLGDFNINVLDISATLYPSLHDICLVLISHRF